MLNLSSLPPVDLARLVSETATGFGLARYQVVSFGYELGPAVASAFPVGVVSPPYLPSVKTYDLNPSEPSADK